MNFVYDVAEEEEEEDQDEEDGPLAIRPRRDRPGGEKK